jgi:toxin-antitoxin system PIN domain toxin
VTIPDLNLLVYAVDRGSPSHEAALRWWNALLAGTETVGLAWTVLLGFVRLTTSSRVVGSPLAPEAALDYVDRWLGQRVVTVVAPTRRHTAVLRDLLAGAGTGGNLVADAHLAALAIEHGATLCSADRDFGRFAGLTLVNPLALGTEPHASTRSARARPSR